MIINHCFTFQHLDINIDVFKVIGIWCALFTWIFHVTCDFRKSVNTVKSIFPELFNSGIIYPYEIILFFRIGAKDLSSMEFESCFVLKR